MAKNIILTGDRPTGKLHLGHLVGSLRNRVAFQNSGDFDEIFIMIADAQAITDNFNDLSKVRSNIMNVAMDYLSVGINPEKSHLFIQSQVSELTEIMFYFMNMVHLGRLERNPTLKSEIKERGFEKSIPVGFFTYPISQAADIVAFNANIVPVGEDQVPVIEQTREIVRSFNATYNANLIEPKAIVPTGKAARLCGIDGPDSKMSKSLGNAIYLADSAEEVKRKVMAMYTDPNHLKITDSGDVDNNPVFIYLSVFATDDDFAEFLPEYQNLGELKAHYKKGGLGDVVVKRFLNDVLQKILTPIREKRAELEKNPEYVISVLKNGSDYARSVAAKTLQYMKETMGLDYFGKNKLV